MGLYSKDTGTKIYLVEVDGANAGLKVRRQYIKESKLVEVVYCIVVSSYQTVFFWTASP